MSVYRLLLWRCSHPAIWDPKVQSPVCKGRRCRETVTGEKVQGWQWWQLQLWPSTSIGTKMMLTLLCGDQGSQDMAYWHDWWNQLSGFQRQLILLMSMADDFWSSLTEGQKTVTGNKHVEHLINSCTGLNLLHCILVKKMLKRLFLQVSLLSMLWSFAAGGSLQCRGAWSSTSPLTPPPVGWHVFLVPTFFWSLGWF